ncbi:MAG TPA: hypothetical protein PKK06_03155 [Phycisphaerae bacterium]|nr:hypothetical protein [Phycisphaerae bacterium]HNU44683.1 hypothetical protein [Phycisphaerae bacterium]
MNWMLRGTLVLSAGFFCAAVRVTDATLGVETPQPSAPGVTPATSDHHVGSDGEDTPPPPVALGQADEIEDGRSADCPPGATLEGEPSCHDSYVDETNGGCNSSPYVFQTIACGETYCGESGTYVFNAYNYRDTDWFALDLTTPSVLTWSVWAEFDVQLFIVDAGLGDCGDYWVLASGSGPSGEWLTLSSACAHAGLYWFWVGPTGFTGVPCGAEWVGATTCDPCPGACCTEGTPYCEVVPPYACNGVFLGAERTCDFGSDCDGNGSPDACDLALCNEQLWCQDCNHNYQLDVCDISSGVSLDCQPDEVPDECQVHAAYVWDNGPLVTHPAPAGCQDQDMSALQDGGPPGLYLDSWAYLAAKLPIGTAHIADDFVLETDGTLHTATFFACEIFNTPPPAPTITAVYVQVWDGPPNAGGSVVWGDLTTNRMASVDFAGVWRSALTDLTSCRRCIQEVVADLGDPGPAGLDLPAGTYWIDVAMSASTPVAPWIPPVTILGQTGKPGANALYYFPTEWRSLVDPGDPPFPVPVPQDIPFIIEGGGSVNDCNANAIPDDCDIRSGTSIDCDGNGVPDECEGCNLDADPDYNYNDFLAFADALGACFSDPPPRQYNVKADRDCDGCITLRDYGLWLACYLENAP